MRQLRALRLGGLGRAEGALLYAALPGTQLTCLNFAPDVGPPPPVGALPWLALRELPGVTLHYKDVAPLAAGLPQLRLLTAVPSGDWPRVSAASFQRVTHAMLYQSTEAVADTRLSVLLPSVQALALVSHEGDSYNGYTLDGLTAVTQLRLEDYNFDCPCVNADTISTLCNLPSLTHLSLVIRERDLPCLARLPTTLCGLDFCVVTDDFATTVYADAALSAATHLNRLTTLHLTIAALGGQIVCFASLATLSRFPTRCLPCVSSRCFNTPWARIRQPWTRLNLRCCARTRRCACLRCRWQKMRAIAARLSSWRPSTPRGG